MDQATRLLFLTFSKLSLNINFTIVYDFYYACFPSFYAYLIALQYCLYVYIFPVIIIMSLCDHLSVSQYVFTWQKIDQAGGPETFVNFVWPKIMASC